jgi:exopolyphosphatase/guanosine-5'-triphosphate,3'-diphosphate pyrophosphatase
MNPDRAEVIDYAAQIYIHIMQLAGANEILAPNKGLKDGILHELWNKKLNLS